MATLVSDDLAVTIASGASLSGIIDLGDGVLASIQMPALWTAADLTFQASWDGVTFADLYDAAGVEYVVDAAASRVVLLPIADFLGLRRLKIRSGTSGTPVNQAADRTLQCRLVG